MMAGLTTLLTMSYILAVNPLILSDAGMDKGAVFSATVIAAAVATCVMALYAKLPFALASGMGINAFFAYTLVIVMGYTWQQALAAVCVEGLVFILLTIFKVREAIVNAIPLNLRYSISVGIGLFIAFIGLKNGGLVVSSEATMTTLGAWTPTTLVAAGGILLGAILLALHVKGALFYTIIIMTLIGIPFGVTQIPEGFTLLSMPQSIEPVFLMIPAAATTSALFLVGVMMLRSIVHIDFIDFAEVMPCFVTILMMPFTASISEGIVLGMLSYVIVSVCTGRYQRLTPTVYILSVFFLLKYIAPLL
ncbi:MAG: NCS2 family permease [Prevotella sp.]|nr:NCS2 family permease [Prevotella sp.]